MSNPFHLTGYVSPFYFCNRETETETIINAVNNRRNLTLFSLRRMGKTGLLHHSKHHLSKNGVLFFLVDVYATQNAQQFINELGSRIMGSTDSLPKRIGNKLKEMILSFRPRVTYESLTGMPSVEFYLQQENPSATLEQILSYLDKEKTPVVLAIDEFQQVTRYPEKNFEAVLRSNIQTLKNLRLIFSGSETSLLLSMFNDAKRPFYQSTQMLHLEPIAEADYTKFIAKWMKKGGFSISNDALFRIMELTRSHTYYVQLLCNRLYSTASDQIEAGDVNDTLAQILQEQEYNYFNYRKILSELQWKLLVAISKTEKLRNPNSMEFLQTYSLGAGSSVRRALKALNDKDLVVEIATAEGSYHQISDVFFEKWLQRL